MAAVAAARGGGCCGGSGQVGRVGVEWHLEITGERSRAGEVRVARKIRLVSHCFLAPNWAPALKTS